MCRSPFPESHAVALIVRPAWRLHRRVGRLIHIQMHENVSAGTLTSRVMDSPEASPKWLADNNAPALPIKMHLKIAKQPINLKTPIDDEKDSHLG
jgi:hypothetical protein